jgi:hypothetical protein
MSSSFKAAASSLAEGCPSIGVDEGVNIIGRRRSNVEFVLVSLHNAGTLSDLKIKPAGRDSDRH